MLELQWFPDGKTPKQLLCAIIYISITLSSLQNAFTSPLLFAAS
jgi:hypothetical protein